MRVCVHVCIFTVNILMSYPHWSESYFFLADSADPKNRILHIQVLHCLLVSLYNAKLMYTYLPCMQCMCDFAYF